MLAERLPSGDSWIHELKHDGFRIVAHNDDERVHLWSRNGRTWSVEFVAITAAVALPFARIVLEGEAVAPRAAKPLWRGEACLYAFDLLHVGRDDLRRYELVERREST